MILYVWKYSKIANTFDKTAVIDNATSVIWVQRVRTPGEFELYLRASPEMLELFTGDTLTVHGQKMSTGDIFVTQDNEDRGAMLVEKIELQTDAENGDYLIISGRSAECILGRRIIPTQTNFTGTAENCIRSFINQNVVSPVTGSRRIAIISLGTARGYTETIDKQATGKNLLETISDICGAYEYGFKFTFTGTGFVFNLFKGVDRSTGQTTNNRVIFSPAFENLGNTSYSRDKSTYYNAAYVGGEGEGSARIIQAVQINTSAIGYDRKEIWVDARQTSSDTEGGELTPIQYQALLTQQGQEELENHKELTEFSGEILDTNIYVFGVDYNLGDKVSVVNEYGITGTATVMEMTEVEDETGYKIYPTLSEWSV